MENKLIEVKGNLFDADESFSLVHCVSKDFAMGKGIALEFKNRFGRVEELKRQNARIGGMAYIPVGRRYIVYLVTKEKYFHKPTYESLRSSLINLKDFCLANRIPDLAMPKIGCGLDQLHWENVLPLIQEIFSPAPTRIAIYSF